MFTTTEWINLLRALIRQTDLDRLKWKPSKSPMSFQVKLNPDTIIGIRSVDGDGQPPFELLVLRPKANDESSTTSWTQFGSVTGDELHDQWGPQNGLLQDLHQMIVRKSEGVDKIFESIMKDLDN